MAQIGVLKVLERHNIPIDFIAATSFGAIVGGLYAAGYTPAELESISVATNWEELLSLTEETKRTDLFVDKKLAEDRSFLVVRFDGLQPVLPPAVSSGQRLTVFLNTLTLQALYHPNPSFDDLRISFRSVCTDLISGRRVILDSGSLAEALRASATVPLLFSPIEREGMHLVDGGLLSNIPVDVARDAGCDIVIAVNSTSGLRSESELKAPWQTADQIMGIMMQKPNEVSLQGADVVITPSVGNHLSSNFEDIDTLILKGEEAAEHALDQILTLYAKASSGVGRGNGELDHASTPMGTSPGLTIQGTPGIVHRAPLLNSLEIEGCRLISGDLLQREFSTHFGTPYDSSAVGKSLEHVLRLYRTRGYSLARVRSAQFNDSTGRLFITINEGVISRINVEGGVRTQDNIVLREFPLEPGDVFEIDRARQGITNISSTKLFEYVYLEVAYDEGKPVLTIRLKERPSQLMRFGLRADNERNLQGSIDIRDENFRGSGMELGLNINGGSRNKEAVLEYRANRLFDTYLTFNVGVLVSSYDTYVYGDAPNPEPYTFDRLRLGEYREVRYGGRLVFGAQLERLGSATAELLLENVRIANLENLESLQERYRLSVARIATVLDTKNSYPFPTSGVGLKISYESSFQSLGSEVGYNALRFFYESFSTWGKNHTFHPRLTLGFADKTMPLSEQFRLGGRESFFGAPEDDRRGRQLLMINLEYRYHLPIKLVFDTFVSVRYDAATISTVPEEIKLSSLRHGLGAEIRLDTPFGPAAFGIGKSFVFVRDLPSNPIQEGPFLFYFMIGYQL